MILIFGDNSSVDYISEQVTIVKLTSVCFWGFIFAIIIEMD